MDKDQIYEYLNNNNIKYEISEHIAVYNMEEAYDIKLPYPNASAKNLFIRDNKKQNYYLLTVKGDKKVNLKEFKQNNHTRSLSFASKDDLMSIMKLIPGAVTPLGILNDHDCKVHCFIDEAFFETPGLIGVHPNDNRTTIFLKINDLINILKAHGNKVVIYNFK